MFDIVPIENVVKLVAHVIVSLNITVGHSNLVNLCVGVGSWRISEGSGPVAQLLFT